MKPLILVAFIVTSLATPLLADGHGHILTPTTEWGGFYVGGGFSELGGSHINSGNLAPESAISGSMTAGYAGYMVQNGSLVYGAEAAYSLGSVHETGFPDFQFTDLFDVKARVGFGLGDALFYGVAGWTNATWYANGTNHAANGLNAGVGVDYQVSEQFFLGAEYLFRDLEESATTDFVAPLSSVQIRAGLKF